MTRSWQLRLGIALLSTITGIAAARAQNPPATATKAVPRSVPFSGQVLTPKGEARTGAVMLTFGLYGDQKDSAPIWIEQHLVTLDSEGRYSVILGSTSAEGLPADAFAAGTPRWMGVQVEGETEQPRMMLLSVPYALKAGDADTIAGKPATEFVLSSNLSDSVKSALKESKDATSPSNPTVTTNALVKYANSGGALTESSTVDVGGRIGIQVASPLTELDIAGGGSSTTVTMRNGGSAADVVKLVGSDGSLRIGSATTANMINLIGTNVGLQTVTPGFPLTFPNTLGDKISLYGQSGAHYGFGIQGSLLQIHSMSSSSDIAFGHGSSGAFTERTRMTGFGVLALDQADANNGALNNGTASGAGLVFGAGSGEGIASKRTTFGNQFGLDFYTGFVPRMSISSVGDVVVGPFGVNKGNLTVSGNGNGVQGVAVINRTGDDGTLIRFRRDGGTEGSIDVAAGVVTYNAFTGSHYARTNETIERGMLVSLTGENGRLEDRPESEILYGVARSRRANDPAILGAYLARQNRGASDLRDSANPHLVEAVGNGEMWVIDTGRDLAPGEYLVSSAVAGHAMTDPGTFDVSYIVARVAEPIDWKNITTTVTEADGRTHKRALVSVFFENFVIDRTHSTAKETDLAKLRDEIDRLTAKLAALEAREQAREARER